MKVMYGSPCSIPEHLKKLPNCLEWKCFIPTTAINAADIYKDRNRVVTVKPGNVTGVLCSWLLDFTVGDSIDVEIFCVISVKEGAKEAQEYDNI